jgi:hypothetical protein
MKLWWFLFALLILLPSVSALSAQERTILDIKQPVRINGGLTDANTLCNITVKFSNQTKLIDFKGMTFNPDYYNYTLNTSQTSIQGEYTYEITCQGPAGNATQVFPLIINQGGVQPTQSRTDAISRTVYVFLAIVVLFSIAFFLSQNIVYKSTFFLFATLFFLIVINLVFVSLQDEIINPGLTKFFSGFVTISFYLYLAIFILLAVLWLFAMINTVWINQIQKRVERMEN